ncbi:MAG TPA: hypothetical protein VK815_14970 [Candidatus Acidoferrales bacterium]|jgi:hypothetical protein|nr:hypothetical protein [Candidatus Acidoferrales bacterium]
MNSSVIREKLLVVVAVAGAIAILFQKEYADGIHSGLPFISVSTIQMIGFCGVILLIASIFAWMCFLLKGPTEKIIAKVIVRGVDQIGPCNLQVMDEPDLREAHAIIARRMSPPIADLQLLIVNLKKCPNAFQILKSNKGDIIGFFVVYPLKKSAASSIQRGHLTGVEIGTEDIAGVFHRAETCYIAIVLGNGGRMAHGYTLAHLHNFCGNLMRKRAVRFLARPTTSEGLAVVRKHGFTSIDGGAPKMGVCCWH